MTAKRAYTIQAKAGRVRREATKADVIEATRRLLEEGTPVASLSIDRIAKAAGIARGTFYLHFVDKYELIAELAEEQVSWRKTVGAEALADAHLRRDTVKEMISVVVDQWVENRAVLSAIVELAEYDPHAKLLWRRAIDEVTEQAAENYARHWAADDPNRPPDTEMLAEVFSWMWERSCHQITENIDRVPLLKETLTEIIWRVVDYRPA